MNLLLIFLDKIKALFNNEETLEISISPVSDFGLTKKESAKAYKKRINRAIENLETNKSVVVLSDKELENLSSDLLKNE